MMKVKKVILDFIYNFLASMIMTVITQLITYPYLAKIFSADEYGQMLITISIVNIITAMFGNTLNNLRLIRQNKYENEKIVGDYNFLLTFVTVLAFVLMIGICRFYFKYSTIYTLLISIITILGVIRNYAVVAYRIIINFRKIMLSNLCIGIGYVIGIVTTKFCLNWTIPFLFGEVFGCIYVLFTTDILREPLRKTCLFQSSISKYCILIGTSFMANTINYLDRLLIYPVLGGEMVSTYTVAAFFGKCLGILVSPLSGVLLSYYSKKNFKITQKLFWIINICGIICAFMFYIVSYFLSDYVTAFLYPTLYENARPYIRIANLAAVIGILANLSNPIILKFADTKWQMVLQIVYGIVYFGLSAFSLGKFGLYGFCYAVIAANLVRLVLIYIVGGASIMAINKGENIE